MAKLFGTLSLLLTVIIAASSASILSTNPVKVNVVSSEQMKEFLQQNPNAIELERKVHFEIDTPEAKSGIAPAVLIEYTFGSRVHGDFNIAYDNQNQSGSTPKNVKALISYPPYGQYGKILSYVSIMCVQSSHNGRAFITGGAIGSVHISITVEAFDTTIYEHYANFYGY